MYIYIYIYNFIWGFDYKLTNYNFKKVLMFCLRPVRLLRVWISEGLTQADS